MKTQIKKERRVKKSKVEETEKLEKIIEKKRHLLAHALKIPPAINQFKTILSNDDTTHLFDLLRKYKPENRREKAQRLKKLAENNGVHEGPKPNIIKFGNKHVVKLIEEKKAKLVVIAADVDPIEVVIYIPTLCKKMGIPYALVSSKNELGSLVNLKSTAVIALTGFNSEDSLKMNEFVSKAKSLFNDCYETVMSVWGGGVLLNKQVESADIVNN